MRLREFVESRPGTVVAQVTPMKNGEVDEANLRKLIQFHLAAKTPAILLCGTTGESATLSHSEHDRVIQIGVETVKSWREAHPESTTQLWAGTGSNATGEALDLTKHAEEAGADVALVITPYYNKPTPAGMMDYFGRIAEAVEMPIVVYNVPGRTGVNLGTETTIELSEIPNIVGVKEASGNLGQISEIAAGTPDDFLVWSGDDPMTLPILSVGGVGIVSVTGNIVPWEIESLVQAFRRGDMAEALRLHRRLYKLHKTMFIETNPMPVKTAVNLLHEAYRNGAPSSASGPAAEYLPLMPDAGEFRSPMVPMTDAGREKLIGVLREYGLLP